jgi:hypothetical protein
VVVGMSAALLISLAVGACTTSPSTSSARLTSSKTSQAAAHATTSTTDGPATNPTTTSTTVAKGSVTTTTDVSIPLSAIKDTGFPSTVGPGPLKAPVVKQMMQFFETQVSNAYANGDATALEPYLAGGMLTGNKGTINVLNGQHQRNIYKITVGSVSLDNNEKDRVVFDMSGAMTTDYFEDTSTNQPVADGEPGPSSVDFLIFFDFNPTNHTWYWTGEQNLSNNGSGAASGVGG